jgi:hypothetical protein
VTNIRKGISQIGCIRYGCWQVAIRCSQCAWLMIEPLSDTLGLSTYPK